MVDLQRVTRLTTPPIVGQRYLVPTVTYPWLSSIKERPWPVFPNRHEDAEIIGFAPYHYHVDPRFLSPTDWAIVGRYSYRFDAETTVQVYPLSRRERSGARPHPPIVWRPRYCYRELPRDGALTSKMQPHFAGQQCAESRHGWVCPHRNYPLGSVPVIDGVITCPLHGLRISAGTGTVVSLAPT